MTAATHRELFSVFYQSLMGESLEAMMAEDAAPSLSVSTFNSMLSDVLSAGGKATGVAEQVLEVALILLLTPCSAHLADSIVLLMGRARTPWDTTWRLSTLLTTRRPGCSTLSARCCLGSYRSENGRFVSVADLMMCGCGDDASAAPREAHVSGPRLDLPDCKSSRRPFMIITDEHWDKGFLGLTMS